MSHACADFLTTCRLTRRNLLRAGIAGFAGLNLPTLLQAASRSRGPARAKHVIFLHQFGGPSHIDTFDMKPEAPSGIRGSFRPVASAVPGVRACELLPRMARVMGLLAQIRSVHHRFSNHNPAGYLSLSGHEPPNDKGIFRDSRELFPGYGAWVSRFRPADDPGVPSWVSFPYVILDEFPTPGQTASFLGKPYDPFYVGQNPNRPDFRIPELSLPENVTPERLNDRIGLLKLLDRQTRCLEQSATAGGLDAYRERTVGMLAAASVRKAFDLSREDIKLRDAYGRTAYGQSCLTARRLVEAGVRFVTVYFARYIDGKGDEGGWDTHGNNSQQLKDKLLPVTDQTVPTLLEDLKVRGLLDETLVVWMGEFGRHFHPEIQVGHVICGTGERAIGDSLHAIEPGEVILLGPNLPHVWRYEMDRSSTRIEAMAIHFKAECLGAGFLDLPELRDVRLLLSRACQGLQFVGETRKRLAEQLASLRMRHGFERLLQFLQILHEMARSREVVTLSSSIPQPFAAELEQDRLQRVFDFVAGHFQEGIHRDAAADLACLSPGAFSRFFKAHTGMNFSDFVADVRVGHACRLLLQPEIPINAIALRCGFEDLSTFNRAFRKRREMSPTEYRRRMAVLSRIGDPTQITRIGP